MNRRWLAAAAAFGLLATACSPSESDVQILRRALDRTEAGPHAYRYVENADKRSVEIFVRVEDSFRSQATLALDGVPLLEQVVVDDAVALRLLAPNAWNPATGMHLEPILATGDWLVDPAGAPSVFLPSTEQQSILTDVGVDPLFDAQNAIEYVRQAVDAAGTVQKFSPDSIFYKPSEDPFRDAVEADERRGIERFVAVPPPLPRTEEQVQRLPGPRFFRKLSVYLRDNRTVRVLEVVDFESHEELVKARERREPRFLLEMLSALRKGEGEDPIRPRSWTLEITSQRERIDVALPAQSRTVNLEALTASDRLAQLPDPRALRAAEQPPGDQLGS